MSQHTRPLNRQDYKTLTLAALGGALEFYDFIIFVFFAAVVGELFFPADIPEWLRQVQTFGILPRAIWRVRWAASSWPTLAIWSGARRCSP
jgi:hypothetical protein